MWQSYRWLKIGNFFETLCKHIMLSDGANCTTVLRAVVLTQYRRVTDSFAAAGPRLWNTLPVQLRHCDSVGQFKRLLKTYLFGDWDRGALWHLLGAPCINYLTYLLTYLLTDGQTDGISVASIALAMRALERAVKINLRSLLRCNTSCSKTQSPWQFTPVYSRMSWYFYSAPHCKSVCLSVRLSVCPSVTRRYCVKTTARSTVQFALSDSKMCLVL